MIKGIILDVDGVIVGNKKGYNWPYPNKEVISVLKQLRKQKFIVSLCTAKGTFAIKDTVLSAYLDNPHIGDGGAIIIDFIQNKIIEKSLINNDLAVQMVEVFQKNKIYVEIYTPDNYLIQNKSVSSITEKHSAILYKKPIMVDSLLDEIKNLEVVKVMPIPKDSLEKQKVIDLFSPFKDKLSLQWGIHLTALPNVFGSITTSNVTKSKATEKLSKITGIPLKNFLGVGDGMSDWEFIKLCGYKGAMGNSSQELKNKINSETKNAYIGKSVNENGLLNIFENFKLI